MPAKVTIFWDMSDPRNVGWGWHLLDTESDHAESGGLTLGDVDDDDAEELVTALLAEADLAHAEVKVYGKQHDRAIYRVTVINNKIAAWEWLE